MKRVFSTLGCMELSADQVIAAAIRNQMSGIEVRLDKEERPFGLEKEELPGLKQKLAKVSIELTDLGTGISVAEYNEKITERAKGCIDTAVLAGAKAIRLFLGGAASNPSPGVSYNYEGIVKSLQEICDYGQLSGVEIWAETHSEFSTGKILQKVAEDVGRESFKVIWDVMHPIEFEESLEETMAALDGILAHVHIKDGCRKNAGSEKTASGKVEYRLGRLGEGELPLLPFLKMLKEAGYTGGISLEWESAWHPHLKELYQNLDDLLADYNAFLDQAEENLLPAITDSSWNTFTSAVGKAAVSYNRAEDGLFTL